MRGSFDLLNVTCKQLNRTALNPFLNSTKNGGIDARCKRSLNIVAALTAILCVNWPLLADAVIFHVLLGVCDLIVKGSSPLNIYRPPMKLRQGNIFTSVCHVGGGWVSQVPCPFRGSGYVQDVGGCVRGDHPRTYWIRSANGRYASYWNDFLFRKIFTVF